MDLVGSIRFYVDRMFENVRGMKSLILDRETSAIVGMVCSKTELLKREVVDIDMLHDRGKREEKSNTAAVVYIRPTEENVRLLCEELRDPKFSEYHVFFSNVVQPNQERKRWIEDIAAADEDHLVKQMQELYGDYYAVHDHLCTLNIPSAVPFNRPARHPIVERTVDGVISILLSMKQNPTIRYLSSSPKCVQLAKLLSARIADESELFAFRQKRASKPLLLILDRREDPVTPLLKQWTYTAMAHELIGIHNNVLDLGKVPGGGKKGAESEFVMDPRSDSFYMANMHLNFGEIGENIKELVDEYQASQPNKKESQSIEDLQALIQDAPEIRKKCGEVSKHVSLVFEFKRQTETRMLMELSQVEQELAVTQDHASACEQVANLLHNPRVSPGDALRLVLLYNLRYEATAGNALREFMDQLHEKGLNSSEISLIKKMVSYGGAAKRSFDLFENRDTMARMRSFINQPLKDVKNVYTQHTPLLQQILQGLFAGQLDPGLFPALGPAGRSPQEPPEEVIVFIVGGATYEESLCVAMLNEEFRKQGRDARVVLTSNYIHNSRSFLEEVAAEGAGQDEEVHVMDSSPGAGDVRGRGVDHGAGLGGNVYKRL